MVRWAEAARSVSLHVDYLNPCNFRMFCRDAKVITEAFHSQRADAVFQRVVSSSPRAREAKGRAPVTEADLRDFMLVLVVMAGEKARDGGGKGGRACTLGIGSQAPRTVLVDSCCVYEKVMVIKANETQCTRLFSPPVHGGRPACHGAPAPASAAPGPGPPDAARGAQGQQGHRPLPARVGPQGPGLGRAGKGAPGPDPRQRAGKGRGQCLR